nr:hypothetical protein [Tanacetum cinerariifolium]
RPLPKQRPRKQEHVGRPQIPGFGSAAHARPPPGGKTRYSSRFSTTGRPRYQNPRPRCSSALLEVVVAAAVHDVAKAFLVHDVGRLAAALARAAVHYVGFAGVELGHLLGKIVVAHV